MSIQRTVTRILHLQRTSEADQVPADWAAAEVRRVVGPLNATQRETAVLCGWRGCSVQYQDTMGAAEYAEARRKELADKIAHAFADGVITAEERADIMSIVAPGTGGDVTPQAGGGPGEEDK